MYTINNYYFGKVCSGQRSTAFELTTAMVQLLIGGGFICPAGRTENNGQSTDNVWPRWPFFTGQTFGFLVVLTKHGNTCNRPEIKFTLLRFIRTSIFFHFTCIFLLSKLMRSSLIIIMLHIVYQTVWLVRAEPWPSSISFGRSIRPTTVPFPPTCLLRYITL